MSGKDVRYMFIDDLWWLVQDRQTQFTGQWPEWTASKKQSTETISGLTHKGSAIVEVASPDLRIQSRGSNHKEIPPYTPNSIMASCSIPKMGARGWDEAPK